MAQWCKEFNIQEAQQFGRDTVTRARNAFVEIVKEQNHAEVCAAAAFAVGDPSSLKIFHVYVPHVHDEVLLRMRSVVLSTSSSSSLAGARGRSSKVLNHDLAADIGLTEIPWISEIQALKNKDARSIASGLIIPVRALLQAVEKGARQQSADSSAIVCHILTGDGIATNEAAARWVLAYMRAWCQRIGFVYRQMCIICGGHTSNLVVLTALCGGFVKEPQKTDSICANSSRVFRHLMVDYSEEFSMSLWRWLESETRLLQEHEVDSVAMAAAKDLQKLYGSAVLPDELLEVYNSGLARPHHRPVGDADLPEVRRWFFRVLRNAVIVLDEHPVVSRMFTFVSCVQTLLRYRLLHLPATVFSVSLVKPRAENQARLARFHKYLACADEDANLRVACVSLQLTHYSTSICCEEEHVKPGRLPTLVRLAQGEIQVRTCARLQELVLLQLESELMQLRAWHLLPF